MFAINKIIVDTHYKTAASKSNADFSIELPETVNIPDNTGSMITEISIPNTLFTIDSTNNRLYFRSTRSTLGVLLPTTTDAWVVLASKNYDISSFSAALANALNESITGPGLVVPFYDENQGTLTLTVSDSNVVWGIFTDEELKTKFNATWAGLYYDPDVPRSCNDVLGNSGISTINSQARPFVSGFIDVMPHHNLYLTSPQLGSFGNIGPRGDRTILKNIIVNVGFGEVITYGYIDVDDYTNCSRQAIKTLQFRLCDVHGAVVDLHGAHISFAIRFKNI